MKLVTQSVAHLLQVHFLTQNAEAVVRCVVRPLDIWCCAHVAYKFVHSLPCSANIACHELYSAMLARAWSLLISNRMAVSCWLCCSSLLMNSVFEAAGFSSPTSIISGCWPVIANLSHVSLLLFFPANLANLLMSGSGYLSVSTFPHLRLLG